MDIALDLIRSGFVGILGFLLVLSVVIFVHEFGHFQVGRWLGIKVETFSLGFGKEVWARYDKHGTKWRLALIPLGGYVKFYGDATADSSPDHEAMKTMSANDRSVSFPHQPVWARSLVIAAGPFANFIFSIVVFAAIGWFIGSAQYSNEIVPSSAPMTLASGDVLSESPAKTAGLEDGDKVIALDGQKISVFSEIVEHMDQFSGDMVRVEVDRGGEILAFDVMPALLASAEGSAVPSKKLGIGAKGTFSEDTRVYAGFWQGLELGVWRVWRIISLNLGYVANIFSGKEDGSQLTGIVGISTTVYDVANNKFEDLIALTAFLSVAIGLVNLFPIPVLDGGHLMFNLIEAVRRKPVSERTQEVAFWVGVVLIVSLMGFATFNDFVRIAAGFG